MTSSYSENQLHTNYPDGIENHYWNSSRNKILFHILKKHKLIHKRVLEIGCGRGVVVQHLTKMGLDCYGVDLANGEAIQENSNIFLNRDALNLDLELRESIEVIMLLDVIEHIELPMKFLKEIENAFPNAKYYIIAVPARQEIWSNYDEYYGHFRRYNKKLLNLDASALNGNTIETRYLFHALYYPALIFKIIGAKRNVFLKAPIGRIQIKINQIISTFFYIGYKLKLSSFLGTSLISIIKIKPHEI